MSISEKVLDAIQILADNSVKKADYDRTIQAQILSCEDATIGKYRCRYQDAVFYAYSNNTDITYSNGALVYILVPGNDFKKEKTILGTTKKLGINYITQAEGDQAYDIIGTNGIEDHTTFYLDTSYKNYSYTLYKSSRTKNDINVNQQALQRGHYGITYNLKFIDNATGLQTIRSYTLDEDNMVDQPYRLLYPTRQIQIYNVDGANFVEVDSIELFCKDFPESIEHANSPLIKEEDPHDIQLTLFELVGASRMTEGQINGVAITFYTPQGTFFPAGDSSGQKLIKAQVRVKGKLVAADQRISFYWGKQNLSVTPSSPYYNKYLGRGWKCINSSNIIDSDAETQAPITIEWIPGKDTYIFNYDEATAKDNWLKVAIVYDGNIISKKINIQNLADKPYPIIESSNGTKFYYDVGHPTLTAKLMHKNEAGIEQEIVENVEYYWAYEDNAGNFMELPQTTDLNNTYHTLDAELTEIDRAIQNGTRFENEVAADKTIQNKKSQFKNYDFIQRVEGKQVHNVQIRNITSFGIFKCSIIQKVWNETNKKYDDTYRGTAQITLTNSLDGEGSYSLVINNGSVVYQYNENGVAPNNRTLDNPQQIPALTFIVYDNQGRALDSDMIVNDSKCKVRWKIPTGNDTLLVDNMPSKEEDGEGEKIPVGQYTYYDNVGTLFYGIANKYDVKKQNNQIQLSVNYKDMNLTASTNFTFAKQGEPGTNGTQYVVKIVPNTQMNNPPIWPVITKNAGDNSYWLNYGVGSSASFTNIGVNTVMGNGHPFKAQLWQNGEQIWQGYQRKNNYEGVQPDLIHWEVLKNVYKQGLEDYSALEITSENQVKYLGEKPLEATETDILKITGANIIKCSITYGGQGKTYYGTLPVTTAQVLNGNYRIGLRNFTGFRHVLYTSDGINPQYDNSHPFEFYCEELINNVWEDVSNVQGEHQVTYDFSAIGDYQSYDEKYTPTNANLLTILGEAYRKGLTPNQCPARPAARYDGQCVNVAICCEMYQNGEIIGKIKVPIHYLLNKFGLSHINDWDGNSIQINNNGGYILSPQMGAGVKNSSNQFTGVLMGEVITPNKEGSDIGLLGYVDGDRTIFLNSRNGSALFGRANQAQITIDPTADRGMIYSGKFWKNYNQDGLPNDYRYRKFPTEKDREAEDFNQNDEKYFQPNENFINKQGLIIDLTTPEIYFGTGNFYVTKDGYIHAKGGGDIAGWQVSDTKLSSKNTAITLDSSGKIYSTKIVEKDGERVPQPHDSLNSPNEGFYLAANGLSIGDKFKVSNQGRLFIGEGAVKGDTDCKYWDINGYIDTDKEGKPIYDANGKIKRRSYISYGGVTSFAQAKTWEELNTNKALVYIGTDGLALGKRFSVDANGKLTAYSGTIGGWTINSTNIIGGIEKKDANNNVYLEDSVELNKNGTIKQIHRKSPTDKGTSSWSITSTGEATFKRGTIGGWQLKQQYTDKDGHTYPDRLVGGKITLNSTGSITGPTWSINSEGVAHFGQIYGKVMSGKSFTANGFVLGGGGVNGGSSISPSTVGMSGGAGLSSPGSFGAGLYDAYKTEFDKLYIKEADIDSAWIRKKLNYKGFEAKWSPVVTDVSLTSLGEGKYTLSRERYYGLICNLRPGGR